jgi:predicted RNase H-like HicB family nuclease
MWLRLRWRFTAKANKKRFGSAEQEKIMRYGYVIEKTTTGFSAYVPDLPGCIATGKTKELVRQRIQEVVEIHLKSMLEDGDPIREPTSQCEYLDVQLAS